ncbi:MAG: glycosyltransferase [Frankiales bacterium]|nr:MAG: glycosyltransferase [Frankiales bacterium]
MSAVDRTRRDLGRRAPLFVSWMRHHGRSEDLSRALGATPVFLSVGRLTDRRTAPVRHLLQAVLTIAVLVRRRPPVLWVMAPPTSLVVLGLLWSRLTGCRIGVDAHTGAVLEPATGEPRSVRWLRRADVVVVTTERLAVPLRAKGVRACALHDPPVATSTAPPSGRVVMPASWYPDEPWADVVGAAALLPDVAFVVTGRPPAALSDVPPNLTLSGYLDRGEYDDLVASADVVLALTTREDTMQRAAYEAVGAGRPVVASGTDALREYLFRGAVFTDGGPESLAEAVRTALRDRDRLAAEVVVLRDEHEKAFAAGLAAVAAAVAER